MCFFKNHSKISTKIPVLDRFLFYKKVLNKVNASGLQLISKAFKLVNNENKLLY